MNFYSSTISVATRFYTTVEQRDQTHIHERNKELKIRADQSLKSFDNFAHAMQTKSAIHVRGGLGRDGARSAFDDE